jgi:hypothetical protein
MQAETNGVDLMRAGEKTSNECRSGSGSRSETVVPLWGRSAHLQEEQDSAVRDPAPGIAEILALRVGCWQPPLHVQMPLPAAS